MVRYWPVLSDFPEHTSPPSRKYSRKLTKSAADSGTLNTVSNCDHRHVSNLRYGAGRNSGNYQENIACPGNGSWRIAGHSIVFFRFTFSSAYFILRTTYNGINHYAILRDGVGFPPIKNAISARFGAGFPPDCVYTMTAYRAVRYSELAGDVEKFVSVYRLVEFIGILLLLTSVSFGREIVTGNRNLRV
ncbi:unnamed protein product [Nesidiocoris tenuis]|uniref:Uncharacterized protein n=1 Tax=Nesidiocoris tenuis TaxID=355587 RepID=A0A6H5FW37_9HEMI|nr:unnamed protein product [Nesidiocoris tenuis]